MPAMPGTLLLRGVGEEPYADTQPCSGNHDDQGESCSSYCPFYLFSSTSIDACTAGFQLDSQAGEEQIFELVCFFTDLLP